jgi:hypothetical protein
MRRRVSGTQNFQNTGSPPNDFPRSPPSISWNFDSGRGDGGKPDAEPDERRPRHRQQPDHLPRARRRPSGQVRKSGYPADDH